MTPKKVAQNKSGQGKGVSKDKLPSPDPDDEESQSQSVTKPPAEFHCQFSNYCKRFNLEHERSTHEKTCPYRHGATPIDFSVPDTRAPPSAATAPTVQPPALASSATPAATSNATPLATRDWVPCRYCDLRCSGETNGKSILAIHEAQCVYRPGGALYNAGFRAIATMGQSVQTQAVTSNATPAATSNTTHAATSNATPAAQATPAAHTVSTIPPQQVANVSASSTSSAQVHAGSGTAHANQTSTAPNTQAPPSAATGSTVQPPAVTSGAVPTAPSIPPQQIVNPSASSTSSAQVHPGLGTAHANQTSSAPNAQAPSRAATGPTVQSQAVPPSAAPAVTAMTPQQVAVPSAHGHSVPTPQSTNLNSRVRTPSGRATIAALCTSSIADFGLP